MPEERGSPVPWENCERQPPPKIETSHSLKRGRRCDVTGAKRSSSDHDGHDCQNINEAISNPRENVRPRGTWLIDRAISQGLNHVHDADRAR